MGLNNSGQQIEKQKATVGGPLYGLKVVLYPFKHENYFARIKDFGVIVFVHNSSLRPTAFDGVFIEPGKSSYIQVKRTFINNYQSPYTACNDLSTFSSDLFDFIKSCPFYTTYRQIDCFNLCVQQLIMNICNCTYSGFDNPIVNTTVRPCLTLDDFNCYTDMFYQFDPIECESRSCPLECNTVEYDLQVSSLIDPSTDKYYGECNPYHYIPECYADTSMTYDDYRTLYVTFNVYYPSLKYTLIDVTPAMSIFSLLSNIGGSMSLIVSVSFFTLFEMAELFFLMVYVLAFNKNSQIFPKLEE